MKWLRKIYSNPHFWPVVIVLFFAILASRTLLFQQGYFNMHDDLQMMRQLQMEKCFADGQIPCRWVPDMGYGFGFPLFNFYPPLPYLIGQGIRVLGLSFISTAKLLFALSFLVSGVGMYLLAQEFFKRLGGVVSAIFYIWAPYHAVDVYVRGAMNEAWALAIFPFIFWTTYKIVTEKKNLTKWIGGLALSTFALLTSHNLMVLIFGPLTVIWALFWMWREKSWKSLPYLIKAGLLALGLAAFFTFPAVVENKYTQIRGQLIGYYDYTAHFVSLKQLLVSRFWGYGPSVWDVKDDGMSFQVGHIHWILSLVIGAWSAFKLRLAKKKEEKAIYGMLLLLFAVGWVSTFLAHSRSTFIWQLIPPLGYLQFSWRFLTIIIFSFSFIAGSLVYLWQKNRLGKKVAIVLALGLVILNWNYFVPENGRMGKLTDEEKFSNAAWDLQQTAGIYDYLPVWAETAPKEPMKNLAEFMSGEGEIMSTEQGTNWARVKLNARGYIDMVRLGIFKFPGWTVYVDGKETETFVPEEEKWGRMWFVVTKGEHDIEVRLEDTPVRKVSDLISLATWIGLLSYPLWKGKLPKSSPKKKRVVKSKRG